MLRKRRPEGNRESSLWDGWLESIYIYIHIYIYTVYIYIYIYIIYLIYKSNNSMGESQWYYQCVPIVVGIGSFLNDSF